MSEARDDGPELRRVWDALQTVPDPEIPTVSIVELGMVAGVSIDGGAVTVRLTPSFAACPAIGHIHKTIGEAVERAGFATAHVETVYDPPWTSDRISEEGRRKLKEFGLAPPVRLGGRSVEPPDITQIVCPHCDSEDTLLESAFGSTLCRSIHYCNACRQSFEHFKPVS